MIVLFLFWAGTLAMFVAYIRSQRGIAALQSGLYASVGAVERLAGGVVALFSLQP